MTHTFSSSWNSRVIVVHAYVTQTVNVDNITYSNSEFNFIEFHGFSHNQTSSLWMSNILIHDLNFETDADIVVFDQYFNDFDLINVEIS